MRHRTFDRERVGYQSRDQTDDQLGMVQALIDGEIYSRARKVWRENDAGERVLVERPKRMRPWY